MLIKGNITPQSVRRVQQSLKTIQKGSGGPGLLKVNRQVGVWLHRWVNENFRSEGGKVGNWKPFAAGGRWRSVGRVRKKLRGRKRKFDANAKLLQDTGRLRASFDTKVTQKTVTIGSDLEYSKYHEFGIGKGLPARRMLPRHTDSDVAKHLLRIYDNHINTTIKKA